MACHSLSIEARNTGLKKIAIVGCPNVGKSVLFNKLTGCYVTVSNYPGTTVEVSRGKASIEGREWEVIDTPGLYTFTPISEEEKVALDILVEEKPSVVVHVIEAIGLKRMLPFTLQLIKVSLPTVLVLNMMDEAEDLLMKIDVGVLEKELGIPVIAAVATKGRGIEALKKKIGEMARTSGEDEPAKMFRLLDENPVDLKDRSEDPVEYQLAIHHKKEAALVAAKVMKFTGDQKGIRQRLDSFLMHPVTGSLFLFGVLYFGIYQFVGVFGAGTVVNFLEDTVFGKFVNPFVTENTVRIIRWEVLQSLFVGEYGVITLGFRYAVALILPIVTFFFIVFSVIEDTGYLPRLAMLLDGVFKKIGLSGRAVIPMVLGFGCATMATLVTRTLPSKRERMIATLLLSLAIPCSAQLGVIMALLSHRPKAMMMWMAVIVVVFLLVGSITAKILRGAKPSFYMELPPLRWPNLSNVGMKTYSRVKWYFIEILPLFLWVSVFIWVGQITGLFGIFIGWLSVPMRSMGLPAEASKAFLFGFFRRDYGAAGLYDLSKRGVLNGRQLVVACVALTLFLPCVAQFLINMKERGWKTGLGISVFILFFSFGTAWLVNLLLSGWGIPL